MGKYFYGTSNIKEEAKSLANLRAKNYRRAKCYTPASDKTCSKLEDGNWKCRAAAHHHRGSCDSSTIDAKSVDTSNDSTENLPEQYSDATPADYAEVEE